MCVHDITNENMFFIFALHDDDNIKGYLLILNIMENNDDMHFSHYFIDIG